MRIDFFFYLEPLVIARIHRAERLRRKPRILGQIHAAAVLQNDPVPANLPDTAPLGELARALALDHTRAAAEPVEA